MKKSIAVVAMAFGVTSAFAQDLTSKKGEPFLPEAGDYAISVNAEPFLNYVGTFFGKTNTSGSPTFGFLNNTNLIITGKKFKDATNAYRASVRLGFDNTSTKTETADRAVTTAATYPDLPTMVTNKHSKSNTNIGISVGIEKRRGKTRLQGLYGAEAGIFYGSTKDKYTYGNELNPTGTPAVNVAAADGMNGNANLVNDTYGNAARVTVRKGGASFSIGVRGFVGAEYFVAPKISIGGEFGWGIGFGLTGKSKTTTESVGLDGSGTQVVGEQTVEGGKSSSFMLDTDNKNSFFGPSGTLRLNLHF